jgi:hypothetical protein
MSFWMTETFCEYRTSEGSTKFLGNFGEKGGAKRHPEELQKVLEMNCFYPNLPLSHSQKIFMSPILT